MRTSTFSLAIVLTLTLTACGDKKKTNVEPPPTRGEPTATPAADCPALPICSILPSARIDAACGTKTIETVNTGVPTSELETRRDDCRYLVSKDRDRESAGVYIGRSCYGGASGLANAMNEFKDWRARQDHNEMDIPGLGDEAYYAPHMRELFVRQGRFFFMIANGSITPETEAKLKDGCLVALYKELAAK